MLTARYDVRRGELDTRRQRVHRRHRRAEEPAHARRVAPPAEAARGRRGGARRHERRRARRRAGAAQQGADGDGARAGDHRQPRGEGAGRRRHLGQGEPRRPVLLLHRAWCCRSTAKETRRSPAATSPTSSRAARWKCAPRSPRPIATTCRRASRPTVQIDALPGRTFTAKVGALSGSALARQLLRDERGAPVRRHPRAREARSGDARRLVAARRHRRARSSSRRFTCRGRRCSRRTARTSSSSRSAIASIGAT